MPVNIATGVLYQLMLFDYKLILVEVVEELTIILVVNLERVIHVYPYRLLHIIVDGTGTLNCLAAKN